MITDRKTDVRFVVDINDVESIQDTGQHRPHIYIFISIRAAPYLFKANRLNDLKAGAHQLLFGVQLVAGQ